MARPLSKRAKARAKRITREEYQKQVKERIEERATDLGMTVQDFCETDTGEYDIW